MYHHRADPGTPGTPPTPPTFEVTELIALDDTWRYNDTGEQLAAGWQQSSHAVGGNWSQGTGLIGFEDPANVPAPGLGTTLTDP